MQSVAEQNVDHLEVIVVDDASTDDTVEVVSKVQGAWSMEGKEAPGLRLLQQSSNAGPAAARNKGIAEASGDWVAFLDSDDTWLPDKLRSQIAISSEHPEIELWCGEVATMSPQTMDHRPETIDHRRKAGDRGDRCRESAEASRENHLNDPVTSRPFRPSCEHPVDSVQYLSLNDLVVSNPIATSTVMVRRSVLEEVGGFDEQFRGPEDYDLWLRIAALGSVSLTEHTGVTEKRGQWTVDRGQRSEGRGQGERSTHPMPHAPCDLRIAKIEVPLAKYRSESGSLSMDDRKFLPQVLMVMDKAFGEGGALAEFQDKKPLALANQYWNASWMAFNRGSRADAVKLWFKGYILGGRKLRRPWLRLFVRYVLGSQRY